MANRKFADATNYLSAGPICIGTLAQLCLISTSGDFSLDDSKKEFKVLTCPNSFRASLYQVTASTVTAFMESHSAMDVVSRETDNVKGYLEQALAILFKVSNILIKLTYRVQGVPLSEYQTCSIIFIFRSPVGTPCAFFFFARANFALARV